MAFAPRGWVLYVIGDIHGCARLFQDLLQKITADAERQPPDLSCELILLGDYVDRGPDSRLVVDLVLSTLGDRRFRKVTALKGNHEEAMLRFLGDAEYWPTWSQFGARETLLAYGVPTPPIMSERAQWAEARDRFEEALPLDHMDFFRVLELSALRGDYFCAHAGVRPNVSLDRQSERDLLWIRNDFLLYQHSFDKVIVHGHTPAPVFVGRNRIGLDTGAYATGALTGIRLKGADRTVLQVHGAADSVPPISGMAQSPRR